MEISNACETRKHKCFLTIQGTSALLQRLCMTLVTIVACQHQPLLRQACWKRKKMNNFAWAAKKEHFWISGALQAYFHSLKASNNVHTTVKNAYIANLALKLEKAKKKPAFSSRLPLSRHIVYLATISVNHGILLSFYAGAHDPHTTLAAGE